MAVKILTADEVRAIRKRSTLYGCDPLSIRYVASNTRIDVPALCESHEALRAEVERLKKLAGHVRSLADNANHERGCEIHEVNACTCWIADLESALAEAER